MSSTSSLAKNSTAQIINLGGWLPMASLNWPGDNCMNNSFTEVVKSKSQGEMTSILIKRLGCR
jgi:hypothetical protein